CRLSRTVFHSCIASAVFLFFFFFKQKTAYEMCYRDWSSDVCSSDLFYTFGEALAPLVERVERNGDQADPPVARIEQHGLVGPHRSEERRVGKECRTGEVA